MTVYAALTDLIQQTVTVHKYGGENEYAEPSFPTTESHTVRYVKKSRMVRTFEGKEVVSNAHFWAAGTAGITVKDRVTPPGESAPRIILTVEGFPDETGAIDHIKVYL